jgi:hypothetical protein
MVKIINKWVQAEKIKQSPDIAQHYPETELYSSDKLQDFLNRYPFVYIKPIGGREGKGVIRIGKNSTGSYTINGYTITGSKIDREINSFEKAIDILHSFYFRKSYPKSIIQQGISSMTPDGQALGVRVHIQYVQGGWILGGMLGKIGNSDDGIVNRNCGAWALPIRQLLLQHLQMDEQQAQKLEMEIGEICLEAGNIFHNEYDWLVECGIDIGIDQSRKVWIFEVNMRPSIKFFKQLEDQSIYNQILKNRKNRFKNYGQ